MKKSTEKILFGLGVTAATAAVTAIVSKKVTKTLIETALDRDEPKIVKPIVDSKLGAYAEAEPYKSAFPLIKKLEETPMESVSITSEDGTVLMGHYYTCENPKRIIIAMHGWRSTWARDFCASADFLHNSDCNILYVEQRGQGSSGGDYMGFGMTERYDCLAWINFAVSMQTGLPIYLMGISMGASTVLMATGLELPSDVKGVISDCGFTSANEIFKHVASSLHLPYATRKSDVEALCKEKINIGASELSTTDALKNNKLPVLFVHGSDDGFVPVSMTYENYKACAGPKRLFIVPGADHGASYLVDKEGYEREVLLFFNQYDK